jgi:hypothetical protein
MIEKTNPDDGRAGTALPHGPQGDLAYGRTVVGGAAHPDLRCSATTTV